MTMEEAIRRFNLIPIDAALHSLVNLEMRTKYPPDRKALHIAMESINAMQAVRESMAEIIEKAPPDNELDRYSAGVINGLIEANNMIVDEYEKREILI